MTDNNLYSYHVFLFPFQWEYTGEKYKGKPLEIKNNLIDFERMLEESNWKYKPFSIDNRLKYNEFNYFFDFVNDIMYDTGKRKQKNDNERFIAHYEYNIRPDSEYYIINLRDRQYKLHIDSILLHLYNTGVGVLSFHLNNRLMGQKEPEDILKINQYGRRLYPPFFAIEPDLTGNPNIHQPESFKQGLKDSFDIEISNGLTITPFETDGFESYSSQINFDDGTFLLPGFIKNLFFAIPVTTSISSFKRSENQIFLSPVLDDRMFVVCWYGNDTLAESLKKDYYKNTWWYAFTFVDSSSAGITCQSEHLKRQLLKAHTYTRWLNNNTFFGISRYSFVCLTSSIETLKKQYAVFVVNHMQTLYFKLAELCLVQRSCILKFSDEVSKISGLNEEKDKNLSIMVSSLYKQYIRFVNKIYFREITAQEQGIELYDMLQEKMKLKDQVKDLDGEIEELHNYVTLKEQRNESRLITRLTRLSAIFLPASLFAGIFGMNTFSVKINGQTHLQLPWPFWISITIIVLSSITVWRIFISRNLKH